MQQQLEHRQEAAAAPQAAAAQSHPAAATAALPLPIRLPSTPAAVTQQVQSLHLLATNVDSAAHTDLLHLPAELPCDLKPPFGCPSWGRLHQRAIDATKQLAAVTPADPAAADQSPPAGAASFAARWGVPPPASSQRRAPAPAHAHAALRDAYVLLAQHPGLLQLPAGTSPAVDAMLNVRKLARGLCDRLDTMRRQR